MNRYTKKAGLALAIMLASSMFAVTPANAHDDRSRAKIHYSTGGYHDGHHDRHYKNRHWRRHAKRHHNKRHWKYWKKHYRMHKQYTHHDGYRQSYRPSGYRNYDRSGYSIKFYYHGS